MNSIFGEPGKGIHSYRLFGLAAVDVILTIIFVIFIKQYTDLDYIPLIIVVILSFVIIHKIFEVDTALNKAIGL
jgi:hypothetical protein